MIVGGEEVVEITVTSTTRLLIYGRNSSYNCR